MYVPASVLMLLKEWQLCSESGLIGPLIDSKNIRDAKVYSTWRGPLYYHGFASTSLLPRRFSKYLPTKKGTLHRPPSYKLTSWALKFKGESAHNGATRKNTTELKVRFYYN